MGKATFGSGCFWCVEAIYQQFDGVKSVVPGYSGGIIENPSYEEVYTGETGHAEVVQIEYDENKISFKELLEVFFKTHDPTTLNRQGGDIGTHYRSVIFTHSEEQELVARNTIHELELEGAYENSIVTTIELFTAFYEAEKYHKNYFKNNPDKPYCEVVIRPKVEQFEKVFKKKLKQ